ncbi:MAG: hypothetical protein ACRDJW_02285 [Thermomicrobiales bacterium]
MNIGSATDARNSSYPNGVARTAARRALRTRAVQQGVAPISDMAVASDDALATEIYLDWSAHPVGVAIGRAPSPHESWEVAGSELRRRVLAAIAPKAVHGWALDGTFIAAVRWDRDTDRGRDLYFGCWVRLRRPES